jgi:formylglycine-generating enzyme
LGRQSIDVFAACIADEIALRQYHECIALSRSKRRRSSKMSFAETKSLSDRAQSSEALAGEGMLYVPGGTFRMGSDRHYPEEAPVHRVTVDGFWIDRTPVTNRQFRKFVNATGYVTFAELTPKAEDYPNALPHMLKAGSLVFTPPRQTVDLRQ